MFRREVLLAALCIFTTCFVSVNTDRTRKKIYIDISGTAACFRRLNATHTVGCSSTRGGNVGVLHYVESRADIQWILENGTHAPYSALLAPYMFNQTEVEVLINSGKINSILVISANDTEKLDYFSADDTCPNDKYGIYQQDEKYKGCNKMVWNPLGNGFMFRDFNFPIMALTNATEVEILIQKCYEKFNRPHPDGSARSYPLCSAEVRDEMDAAVDTPTCIRRSHLIQGLNQENYCDPLGDHNVVSFTRPITFDHPVANDSIVVAAARLDGSSLFEQIYPNAEGTVTGIVTLLGAAYAIGKVKDTLPENHKPIMFTFFNGEAYDYIGSSRMIYDMEKGVFPTDQTKQGADGKDAVRPISLDNIHSVVEVSQVGLPESGKLWIHHDPLSTESKAKIQKMADTLRSSGAGVGLDLEMTSGDQPLPPASLQSFLKKRRLPGVVVADHKGAYHNKYYNSRLDTASQIGLVYPPDLPRNETDDYITDASVHLQKVATAVARALYSLSTGSDNTSHIEVDNITMANLLSCHLNRGDCELLQQVWPPRAFLRKEPPNYYVGVSTYYPSAGNASVNTHLLLAYFMGEHLNISKDNCTDLQKEDHTSSYIYSAGPKNATGVRNGICIRSTVNMTLARSPAFDIDGYDWNTREYSSWTESQWQRDARSLRVFLVPSREREVMTLCVGLGLFVFSMATTYFLHKRVPVMFHPLRTSL